MNQILGLQEMGMAAPVRVDGGPDSLPYSTFSIGAICLTSTISLSLCTP
ncbi:hypothetical protein FB388_3893 [Pseudonocardia cypriaca]|uniref:Uncharacterized protein n=1 Tax=Pseudonocardia cypriaca TaxID=882449 RepID=A0A543FS94_9PSEU|nr:hypothetical protein FB388_3893 [Pseudonocardia cypriaca]